jgi:hypothetical protein
MPAPPVPVVALLDTLLPGAQRVVRGHAATLLSALEGCAPVGMERSLKLTARGAGHQRFLVSNALSALSREMLFSLPTRLSMPQPLTELYWRRLGEANHLYLGFDEEAGACAFKVYLEFPVRLRDHAGGPLLRRPGTQALGLKWSPQRPEAHVVTRYDLHPGLTWAEMHAALPTEGALAVAARVLQSGLSLAEHHAPAQHLDFLSVSEPGLPRVSWDVNFYPTGLTVAALAPALLDFARAVQAKPSITEKCLQESANTALGHVSMGMGRDGAPFVTVYHACLAPPQLA